MEKEEYDSLKKELKKTIPEENHEWLNGLLKHGNQPGLRRRLDHMHDEYKDIVKEVIPSKRDFSKQVNDTRNYLTHYIPELESKAAKGEDLLTLTYLLTCLIETSLLIEIGLEYDIIKKILPKRYLRMDLLKRNTS